uniref:Uncharacterized protein n=1 Tax=Vespula pensylvanica TaxID=30213 RepID=A0A834KE38_VESPE|nr:hypothetical protein H0235_014926 [Vespula pensylvanica]
MSSSSNGERARSLRVDSAFVSASGTPVFKYIHVGDLRKLLERTTPVKLGSNGGGVGGGGVDGGVGGGSDGGGGGGGLDRRFMRSKERQGGRQSEIGTWRSRHEEMRREEKRNGKERREGDAEVISNVEVEDERIKEKEKRVCKG